MQLRDYQLQGFNDILQYFSEGGKHCIYQAPTGSGKTIVFSYMAQKSALKHKKILILTDRVELLMQTGGALSQFGIQPYNIQAGSKFINFKSQVYIAMCKTLQNRLSLPLWKNWIEKYIDLVIIDEAHKQDFNFIFESKLLENKYVIGFTATPKRSGKMRQLALDYDKIISSITIPELIEQDYLVNDDYYGVTGIDLNNIKYDPMKGDYSENDMFTRFNSPKLYAGVVDNWIKITPNTQTLVFCVNIEHVIHTCEEFNKNGIVAKFLTTKMSKPKEPSKEDNESKWVVYGEKMRLYKLYIDSYYRWSGERGKLIRDFKNKQFHVLINAGILTTGFDCPEIETLVINRATLSLTLWLQMLGRGSRPSINKTHFNILDFGNNASRLGHYSAPRMWNLWHETGKYGEGVPPMKECGINSKGQEIKSNKIGCKRLILASYKTCPFCGFLYPEKKIKEIELSSIVYNNDNYLAVAVKKISEMSNDELFDYFKIKKHKQAWLWRQLYFRGGTQLINSFGQEKKWQKGTIEKAINYVCAL